MGQKLKQAGNSEVETLKRILPPAVHVGELADVMGYIKYAGNPTNNVLPDFVGQECFDSVGRKFYKAVGVEAADWRQATA